MDTDRPATAAARVFPVFSIGGRRWCHEPGTISRQAHVPRTAARPVHQGVRWAGIVRELHRGLRTQGLLAWLRGRSCSEFLPENGSTATALPQEEVALIPRRRGECPVFQFRQALTANATRSSWLRPPEHRLPRRHAEPASPPRLLRRFTHVTPTNVLGGAEPECLASPHDRISRSIAVDLQRSEPVEKHDNLLVHKSSVCSTKPASTAEGIRRAKSLFGGMWFAFR
jgi:hypothetical protein